MAASPVISMHGARTALDALLVLLNAGGAGHLTIRTGAMPATTLTADSGTLLATLGLSATAFGAAADGTSNGLATATAAAISADTDADATGTAGYFRAYDSSNVCIIQGDCGTASSDMILNTTSIVIHSTVSVTSWVVTLPDGTGSD